MNKHRKIISPKSPRQSSLLTQGCGWLGSLSVLSSGILLAQAPPDNYVVPVIVDTAPSPATTPPTAVPAPSASPPQKPVSETPDKPATPLLLPVVPPKPENAPLARPVPVASPGPQLVTSPVVGQTKPASPGSNSPTDANGVYIDPTHYNLGATPYEAPPSVVLSERTTGCQLVLNNGQGVPQAICQPQLADRPTTLPGQGSLPQPGTSVRMGGINIDANGIQIGNTAIPRDFYNRTPRPAMQLGNGNVSLIFPLSVPSPITSVFGWRLHPIMGTWRLHSGTDIGAPMGTPVVAAFAGKVTIADVMGGYGLVIALEHNNGTQETLYAHLSEIFVRPGEWVEQGTVIGRVGSTGLSTGPHLHFEVRQLTPEGWVTVDPGTQLGYALANFDNPFQSASLAVADQRVACFVAGSIAGLPSPFQANSWQDFHLSKTATILVFPSLVPSQEGVAKANLAPVESLNLSSISIANYPGLTFNQPRATTLSMTTPEASGVKGDKDSRWSLDNGSEAAAKQPQPVNLAAQ